MNQFELEHRKQLRLLEKELTNIYALIANEIGAVGQTGAFLVDKDKPFRLEDYPQIEKAVKNLLKKLTKDVGAAIVNGVRSQWSLANRQADELCRVVFGDMIDKLSTAQRLHYFNNNDKALDAFLARKVDGLDLSQRVWKYTDELFRPTVDATLELGIKQGKSAAEMARDLKQYLKYPDKLFRRVRDDEGKLHLSKNALAFHPGQGVYRSSYKNALRLAATENNMAYRSSDNARVQNLDFVVGIEIHLSNNHTLNGEEFHDMCDDLQGKYPKWFKFTGWHPFCYSDDSKVLTSNGWKLFREVQYTDSILSLNPDTRETEWVGITDMQCYDYNGTMIHFHNKSLDCFVTPEHQMVYLNKSDGSIKRKPARDFSKSMGGFYRGAKYSGADVESITVAGRTYDFDTFCEFMGYWLADGSCCGLSGITIAQKDGEKAKEPIIACIERMGFIPTIYTDSVRFYNNELVKYLRTFGKCNEKFVLNEIKNASSRQIGIFLDAFNLCDGYARQPKSFVGSHGNVCKSDKQERMYYTTSERLLGDLCELMLKIGHRPSVSETAPHDSIKKDGTIIKSNHTCYAIRELYSTTATVFEKDTIDYNGKVYDLTLEKNHIMYIMRNGKCFWGSNCRCYTTTILKTQDEVMRDMDGVDRGSVNEVKDLPMQFTDWIAENEDRILRAEERGTLPYFVTDNRDAVFSIIDGTTQETEEGNNQHTILERAAARHAARTSDDIIRTTVRLEDRRAGLTYAQMDNLDEIEKIIGMRRSVPMDFNDADDSNANPNFGWEKGNPYNVNCQSCTVAFVARQRGFDVEARPKTGAPFQTDKWQLRFLNADGTPVDYQWFSIWRILNDRHTVTKKARMDYLNEKTSKPGFYEIYCTWKGDKTAHVFGAERTSNGSLKFFDAQSGESDTNVEEIVSRMGKQIGVIYTDDKILNPDAVKDVLTAPKYGVRGVGDIQGSTVISSTKEKEGRTLAGAMPAINRNKMTGAQKANLKDIASALSVKNVHEVMYFNEADNGNCNPNFNDHNKQGARDNCVESVLAFELRLRGYDVSAKEFLDDEIFNKYAQNPELLFLNDKGNNVGVTNIEINENSRASAILNSLSKNLNDGTRLALWWDGTKSNPKEGHIITAIKIDGELVLYDPQRDHFWSMDSVLDIMDASQGLKYIRLNKASINTSDLSHLLVAK